MSLEILTDRNFKLLAAAETKVEEFSRLLTEYVPGYTQKKLVVDSLKILREKVEAAENKNYLIKTLGKVKGKLDTEEQYLINHYDIHDLKEKVEALAAELQAMIDDGRLTAEEQVVVRDNLRDRLVEARKAEKTKLVEKLEKMLLALSKSKPFELPLPDLEPIYPTFIDLKEIARLEKRVLDKRFLKNLSDEDHKLLEDKKKIEGTMEAFCKRSRNWFETESEFAPRIEKGLDELFKAKADQRKREEEEALERKRRAEDEAIEQKKLAMKEAEDRRAQELEEKLEAKRILAAAKPKKEVVQPKKKEKAVAKKLDPHEFFEMPPKTQAAEPQDDAPVVEVEQTPQVVKTQVQAEKTPVQASVEQLEPTWASTPAPAPRPVKKKAAPVRTEIESKWQSGQTGQDQLDQAQVLDDETADPSLKDALAGGPKAPKKEVQPPPKKKEKKKFTKVAAATLGFDCDNPNF